MCIIHEHTYIVYRHNLIIINHLFADRPKAHPTRRQHRKNHPKHNYFRHHIVNVYIIYTAHTFHHTWYKPHAHIHEPHMHMHHAKNYTNKYIR